jgi:hypothetical protein
VYAGTDPLTGQVRQLKETAKTYAEAEMHLTRLQRQVDEEAHPKTSLTVGQAVAQWLEVATLEDTIRDRYDDLLRLYISPTFGEPAGGHARRGDAGEVLRPAPALPAADDRGTGRDRAHGMYASVSWSSRSSSAQPAASTSAAVAAGGPPGSAASVRWADRATPRGSASS